MENIFIFIFIWQIIFLCWRVLWLLPDWCSFADRTNDNNEIFKKKKKKKKNYFKVSWPKFKFC